MVSDTDIIIILGINPIPQPRKQVLPPLALGNGGRPMARPWERPQARAKARARARASNV